MGEQGVHESTGGYMEEQGDKGSSGDTVEYMEYLGVHSDTWENRGYMDGIYGNKAQGVYGSTGRYMRV